MVINFHDKDYKILFSAKDSKDGERPDFKYRLENPPAELANAQIYIRIDEAGEPVNLSQNKWQFTLGIMVKK